MGGEYPLMHRDFWKKIHRSESRSSATVERRCRRAARAFSIAPQSQALARRSLPNREDHVSSVRWAGIVVHPRPPLICRTFTARFRLLRSALRASFCWNHCPLRAYSCVHSFVDDDS